jgi:hypothetical protein
MMLVLITSNEVQYVVVPAVLLRSDGDEQGCPWLNTKHQRVAHLVHCCPAVHACLLQRASPLAKRHRLLLLLHSLLL